jgi:bifunctional DNA-binding transcriptional regulator/antitoxin component of YhaV-PrlF toxin-antitoxin module
MQKSQRLIGVSEVLKMKQVIKECLETEGEELPSLEIEGKKVYYKEIIHSNDLFRIYQNEQPLSEFSSHVNTGTARPYLTFGSKNKKLLNIKENDVVVIRIRMANREVEFITKIYKWGKIVVPRNVVDSLKIKNHDCVNVKIITKAAFLTKSHKSIDLSQITEYDESVKTLPRGRDFITLYTKRKNPITLPRFIKPSLNLIELLFLVHGDGHYAYKFYFSNKSPELHNFVLENFEKIFRLPRDLWKSRILLSNLENGDYAKEYWKKTVKLRDPQFYSESKSKFNTGPLGNLRTIIDKTILSLVFRYVFDEVKKDMGKKDALHALNGLLAAEGSADIGEVGLHKITLSYSQKEKELFRSVLLKTDIMSLCKDSQDKRFVIANWSNLYYFFKKFLFYEIMPFRIHSKRRKRALEGFLQHSCTKTMVKYLSVLSNYDSLTVKSFSSLLKIRDDSLLNTLKKERYSAFVEIRGKGLNKKPFIISITEEGKSFLKLFAQLRNKTLLTTH